MSSLDRNSTPEPQTCLSFACLHELSVCSEKKKKQKPPNKPQDRNRFSYQQKKQNYQQLSPLPCPQYTKDKPPLLTCHHKRTFSHLPRAEMAETWARQGLLIPPVEPSLPAPLLSFHPLCGGSQPGRC